VRSSLLRGGRQQLYISFKEKYSWYEEASARARLKVGLTQEPGVRGGRSKRNLQADEYVGKLRRNSSNSSQSKRKEIST